MEFKINQLDRDTADGFVNTVHWTASQTDGEFYASTYGATSFVKQEGINYVPYASLTEAQVVDWVKNALGTETVDAMNTQLTNSILDQKTPKTATGIPW